MFGRRKREAEAAQQATPADAADALLGMASGPAGRALRHRLPTDALTALDEFLGHLTTMDPATALSLFVRIDVVDVEGPEQRVVEALENWLGYVEDPDPAYLTSVIQLRDELQ